MFTISWRDCAGPTISIVMACVAVMLPIDIPNDLARWPIPGATWNMGTPIFSARAV